MGELYEQLFAFQNRPPKLQAFLVLHTDTGTGLSCSSFSLLKVSLPKLQEKSLHRMPSTFCYIYSLTERLP